MTSSSHITTGSNISAARPARPATASGQIQEGGNPFEGPRSRPYPNPAQKQPFGHTLFAQSRERAGLQAVPPAFGQHVQSLHQSAWACVSGRAPIAAFANGSAAATIQRPARRPRSCRCSSANRISRLATTREVIRINLDSSGKRATGVTFVDTSGEEWEQPADLVMLSAYCDLQRPAAAAVRNRQALRSRRQHRA